MRPDGEMKRRVNILGYLQMPGGGVGGDPRPYTILLCPGSGIADGSVGPAGGQEGGGPLPVEGHEHRLDRLPGDRLL